MDKAQAIHSFWSSFGWPAIDEQSAYDDANYDEVISWTKYISYEVRTSNIGDSVTLTASLWHKSASWEDISKKADEIAAYIGYGGKQIPIDGGYIWIKLGTPFAQRTAAETGYDIRRIVINISVDFLTTV